VHHQQTGGGQTITRKMML